MNHELTSLLSKLFDLINLYRTPILLLLSFGFGAAGAWLIAGIPFRKELLDLPNDRSSHDVPTPRGGGVGILLAFVVAGMILPLSMTFVIAVSCIACISFYGDYFQLSVRFRLVVHLCCAVAVLAALVPQLGIVKDLVGVSFSSILSALILGLFVLFIAGTSNFYNFMDGINGIAGVSGAIAFGLLGGYTLYLSPPDASGTGFSLLAICVALACLGFLPFNLPRARVFMGDVGSVMLGFLFAVLVIALAGSYGQMICFAALLFPFYADELTTMYIRLRAGESLLEPHRRHLYQVLVNEGGLDHWKVTAAYGILQLAVALAALAACARGAHVVIILLALCFAAFILVTYRVRKSVMETS